MKKVFLSGFDLNQSFYGEIRILCTVKSFDLKAIRNRYLKSRFRKDGKVGSVERRQPSKGGVVEFVMRNSKVESCNVWAEINEPRGIASSKSRLAIASDQEVYICQGEKVNVIKNDWFSYIHALDFSPHSEDHLLIASSGLDCVFEYNLSKNKIINEWYAWDSYKNRSYDSESSSPIYLTRHVEEAKRRTDDGQKVLLISDPKNEYLPTAKRAAFINTVSYNQSDPSRFFATLFHEGKVLDIPFSGLDREVIFENLNTPHGGFDYNDAKIATSTSDGEVYLRRGNQTTVFSFKDLPGKNELMQDKEWLQNSRLINNCIITIDSNRNSFVIFDPENQFYDKIEFNDNWAIQDFVYCSGLNLNLQQLKLYSFD